MPCEPLRALSEVRPPLETPHLESDRMTPTTFLNATVVASLLVLPVGVANSRADDLARMTKRVPDAPTLTIADVPRPTQDDRRFSRMGAGDDCGAADVDRYGVALTPSIYLLNFLFLYFADPELAAMMPAMGLQNFYQ